MQVAADGCTYNGEFFKCQLMYQTLFVIHVLCGVGFVDYLMVCCSQLKVGQCSFTSFCSIYDICVLLASILITGFVVCVACKEFASSNLCHCGFAVGRLISPCSGNVLS